LESHRAKRGRKKYKQIRRGKEKENMGVGGNQSMWKIGQRGVNVGIGGGKQGVFEQVKFKYWQQ